MPIKILFYLFILTAALCVFKLNLGDKLSFLSWNKLNWLWLTFNKDLKISSLLNITKRPKEYWLETETQTSEEEVKDFSECFRAAASLLSLSLSLYLLGFGLVLVLVVGRRPGQRGHLVDDAEPGQLVQEHVSSFVHQVSDDLQRQQVAVVVVLPNTHKLLTDKPLFTRTPRQTRKRRKRFLLLRLILKGITLNHHFISFSFIYLPPSFPPYLMIECV